MGLLNKLIANFHPAGALMRGIQLQERGDPRGAFALFSLAARANIPEAEFRVGRCYLEGSGVPPSRADGVRWVERAAEKGYVEAQALVATLCLHGMAPGFADAGAGAGLFGGQTTAEPDYLSAAKWARRAPPTAKRCSASSLPPVPRPFATSRKATAGMRNRLPAAARRGSLAMRWCWRAIPADLVFRKNSFAI